MCIYLIRDSIMHMTKIGSTTDVQNRLWTLQTGCPQDLELVGYIEADDPQALEQELHRRFEHRHHRGEWFNLSDSDIALILDYHNATIAFEVFIGEEKAAQLQMVFYEKCEAL